MHKLIIWLCLAAAGPAAAQDTMNAAEFDAHVTGRTISYYSAVNPEYGIERYLPGRRVMWSRFDGVCQYGVWYESKGNICFRYDYDPEPKCWAVYDEPGGMRSVFVNRPDGTEIWEYPNRDDPLICNDLSS